MKKKETINGSSIYLRSRVCLFAEGNSETAFVSFIVYESLPPHNLLVSKLIRLNIFFE